MVRADLHLDSDDDEGDTEPPIPEPNYPPQYALRTWRQNQRHGTFPEGGVFNDLDPQLDEDWASITARYNWWVEQLRPREDDNSNRTSKHGGDIWKELDAAEEAPDWQSTLSD